MTNITDPITRNTVLNAIEKQEKSRIEAEKSSANTKARNQIIKEKNLDPNLVGASDSTFNAAAFPKNPAGGVTAQQTPPDVSKAIEDVIKKNPDASADELLIAMDNRGVPRIYSNAFTESRRKQEDRKSVAQTAEEAKIAADLRQEKSDNRRGKADLVTGIIERANTAREMIRNKTNLMNIIDRNNIDSPAWVSAFDAVPLNMGQQFLSPDTVTYRSQMIDGFKEMRTLFSGQTRNSEIKIMEDKMASLYLTDDQKKAILKSRLESYKLPVLEEQAAGEIEAEGTALSPLQFNVAVAKRTDELATDLYNKMLEDQKAVIAQAERKKDTPLDDTDPEDIRILEELLQEAEGNWKEAKKLAKKKGYTLQSSSPKKTKFR